MRARLIALLAAALVAVVAVVVLVAGGDDGDDAAEGGRANVAAAVGDQLEYLDPDSSVVVAIDLRYEGENWEHLRALASRGLREYRALSDEDEELGIPPNVTGALNAFAGFYGLSFDDDVRPLMDGYLVIGVTVPPREPLPPELARIEELLDGAEPGPRGTFMRNGKVVRGPDGKPLTFRDTERVFEAEQRIDEKAEPSVVAAYRTREGNLNRVAEKVFEGDEPEGLGEHEDARLLDPQTAVVGDDTLVFAEGDAGNSLDEPSRALAAALERAENGEGYLVDSLAGAQRETAADDPLVVASGSLDLARLWVEERNLDRARREVPWLGAIRGLSAALSIDADGLDGIVRADTSGGDLEPSDLPVGGAGELELPDRGDAIVSGTRDQSVTTAFMARLARSLFADSRFVEAVERAETELRIDFEEEFLRQFGCPSVSVFEPGPQRFAARSCVEDPERMRKLLPRLAPFLPDIVTGLQGLDGEGLAALLLVAPDAPLTPSAFGGLAQVLVEPLTGGDEEEQLYTLRGLRNREDPVGPDSVVFGMIGEDFVVGSDRETARAAADLETDTHPTEAASAARVPASLLTTEVDDGTEAKVARRLVEGLTSEIVGSPSGLTGRARIEFRR